jgi:hypothetical protein
MSNDNTTRNWLLIVLALVLVAAGIWFFMSRGKENALAAERAACDERVATLTTAGESWAGTLATGQAEAAFRAFAAGVHPLVLRGGQSGGLDQAIGALLELPGVAFVHLLAADGTVIASSDRKLSTTGQVGDAGAWVLSTTDMVSRGGDVPGTIEIGAPVVGAAGPAGYLWMGYAVDEVREGARPAGWAGDTEAEEV